MSKLLEEVNRCVEVLREGKVILYPTDTVWGIGCDAGNEAAVNKMSAFKKRDAGKPFIVLVADINDLSLYMNTVPDLAWDLVEFAENPLTVVYPSGINVAPSVLSVNGDIAIRVVKDEFCRQVIRRLKKPLVSTSANISGGRSPFSFAEIDENLKKQVDYIAAHRQNEILNAKPSTIVKLDLDGTIKFLRR